MDALLDYFLPVGIAVSLALSPTFTTLRNTVLLYAGLKLWQNKYGYGISRFPGPFWASITYIWRLRDAYVNGDKRPSFVPLHDQYGEIVRLGPKTLSFANPEALDAIYGSGAFPKSRWYVAFEAHGKGNMKANIFSTPNVHWHARYREAVRPGFEIENFGKQEPQVDNMAKQLLAIMDEQSEKPNPIDLPLTLQFFTFDVGGQVSFNRPYGFLNEKKDIDGIIQAVRVGSTHLNRMAQLPLFQLMFDYNPLPKWFPFLAPPMAFAKKHLPVSRIAEQMKIPNKNDGRVDLLDSFLKAAKDLPGVVTPNEAVDLGLMVVVPASEAVRTAIAVCVFQIMNNPGALKKLQEEIDTTLTDRSVIPSWETTSKHMPYLDACIKETFRIHPSTGFLLERVVPPGGALICGQWIPGGTIVGTTGWQIHRHKPTFGDDVDVFRPERWLDVSPERRAIMEKYLIPFGAGSRTCLGKDVGLFEVYKMTATLFSRYEFTLEKPNEDMKITWGNIVSVDFGVRIKRRKFWGEAL